MQPSIMTKNQLAHFCPTCPNAQYPDNLGKWAQHYSAHSAHGAHPFERVSKMSSERSRLFTVFNLFSSLNELNKLNTLNMLFCSRLFTVFIYL